MWALQALENKALSRGTREKSAPMLAEFRYRKSQNLEGGWPTVTHEPGLSTAAENSEAIFSRIPHEFGTHHDP